MCRCPRAAESREVRSGLSSRLSYSFHSGSYGFIYSQVRGLGGGRGLMVMRVPLPLSGPLAPSAGSVWRGSALPAAERPGCARCGPGSSGRRHETSLNHTPTFSTPHRRDTRTPGHCRSITLGAAVSAWNSSFLPPTLIQSKEDVIVSFSPFCSLFIYLLRPIELL